MPVPRRLVVPVGDSPRARRASQRVSAVAVLLTVLALGGAVAGVYSTGVTLGARIAPGDDEAVASDAPERGTAPERAGDGVGDDRSPTSDGDAVGTTALPDRAQGAGVDTTTTPPGTTGVGDAGPGGTPGPGGGASTSDPYPGLWPYASWDEVRQYQGSGDRRFASAGETARRFAREVVGLTDPTIGAVDEGPTEASVEVRSAGGSSLVTLTRAGTNGSLDGAPWGVTGARGGVGLDAPATSAGATLPVTSDGNPGVVGVHDRVGWRGVGVAARPGDTVDLRLDVGSAGPAMVVAFGGDPREPSTFTMQRVELGAEGAPAEAAPADAVAAAQALVAAAQRGDVGAVWELLTPDARASVRDWRGLAGRLPALRERLAAVASAPLTSTAVATGAGPVAVVAPSVPTGSSSSEGTIPALAFVGSGGARLASLEPGAVTWSGPQGPDRAVVASGPARPVALVVDGAVWSAAPDGATGLRAAADTLAVGTHLAIAVVDEGGRITASAYLFEVTEPLDAPVDPPSGSGPPALGPTSAPAATEPDDRPSTPTAGVAANEPRTTVAAG